LRRGASPGAQTCYNLTVTSPDAPHVSAPPASAPPVRGREPRTGIPAVFILGVVLMVIALATVSMKGLATGGDNPDLPASSSVVSGATSQSAGATAPSSSATGSTAPSSSPTLSPSPAAPTYSATWAPNLTGYVWPLQGSVVVTLPFGPSDWGEFFLDGKRIHDGVDMATKCGDFVHAAHDGVVLAASREYDAYMGWVGDITPYIDLVNKKNWWPSLPIVIVIDDGDGYRSIYAHEYQVTVKPGQHVKAGQVIGYEGATGNASGCHVHFGLFSPSQTATFELDPVIVAKDLMPRYEIARIDPLLVLPFRCEIEEMRILRPAEATPCPVLPTSQTSGKAAPTAKPSPQL
jgi:murein DD-endopeptidase MepM/ murein hydrolase activator NlpD